MTNQKQRSIGDLNKKRLKHNGVTSNLIKCQSNDQFQLVYLRIYKQA